MCRVEQGAAAGVVRESEVCFPGWVGVNGGVLTDEPFKADEMLGSGDE